MGNVNKLLGTLRGRKWGNRERKYLKTEIEDVKA